MNRRTKALIDTQSLRHNLAILKAWAGNNFFCPMVKANAYGHGLELAARVAEETGVSALGVALVEEGSHLRRAGLQSEILTFAPLHREGAQAVLTDRLTPVVTRFEDLDALEAVRGAETVSVHIKMNTGMQRLGFDSAELPRLKGRLAAYPWMKVAGTCTHLTHGDEADQSGANSELQFKKFLKMSHEFPGVRHAHKSASLAVLKEKVAQGEIGARPGIGIYGLPHSDFLTGDGLRPVLTWITQIAIIHEVQKGESVSYSGRWTAPRKSLIGVLPMGYADGYPRALSQRGFVLCQGQRAPVVGSVCMDYTLIDLTDISSAADLRPGESVVVLGRQGQDQISAAEIGSWMNTIAYEVVTAISARVPREAI